MDFFCLLRQLKIHEVAHRQERHHAAIPCHRKVAAVVRVHALHSLFEGSGFLDGRNIGRHDAADRRALRIAALHDDPFHQVAFAENPAQLDAIEYEDGTYMEIGHLTGHLRYYLMLFDGEELSLMHDIADPGHTHPPRRPRKYITNGSCVTDDNDTVPARMRFECQPGCTECCRQQGFVYLSEADIERAAAYLGMTPKSFERKYVYRTTNRLRLRIPRRTHCHFLHEGGCGIHPAKPTQCRTFPFWPELVDHPRAWAKTAKYCPGVGQGPLIQIAVARAGAAEMREALPNHYPSVK